MGRRNDPELQRIARYAYEALSKETAARMAFANRTCADDAAELLARRQHATRVYEWWLATYVRVATQGEAE